MDRRGLRRETAPTRLQPSGTEGPDPPQRQSSFDPADGLQKTHNAVHFRGFGGAGRPGNLNTAQNGRIDVQSHPQAGSRSAIGFFWRQSFSDSFPKAILSNTEGMRADFEDAGSELTIVWFLRFV